MTLQYVHALVLCAFVGPRPAGQVCRHLDGNRANNMLANIIWGTYAENSADCVVHGTTNRGVKNGHARLTEVQVRGMRKLHAKGGTTRAEIAARYGIAVTTANAIIRRAAWRHI